MLIPNPVPLLNTNALRDRAAAARSRLPAPGGHQELDHKPPF